MDKFLGLGVYEVFSALELCCSTSTLRRRRCVTSSPARILAVPRQRLWMQLMPAVLRVFFLIDSPRKLPQPGIGAPRRQQYVHSLGLFAGLSATNLQDRGIRRHGTPAFVTSSLATSGPRSTNWHDRVLNRPDGDTLQAP